MKLSALAKKPQLEKVTLDDEKIVEKYGEELEFFVYDRYDMDVYMELMNTEENDFASMSKTAKNLVFNEDGTPMLKDGDILPSDVTIRLVETVVSHLGNSVNQISVE